MALPYFPGSTLADVVDEVIGLGPSTPSGSSPAYISLKNADIVEVCITGLNASVVTGSAVTLLQAKTVAGANSKALSFTNYYSNVDATANSMLTAATATNSTFTTVTTNSKAFCYRIPVRPAMLDVTNGFDCLGVGVANAVNTTLSVSYKVVQKYTGNAILNPNLLAD